MRYPIALLVALLGLLGACAPDPPTQHDPQVYGTVTVYVDPAWLGSDQTNIRAELVNLNALGPTVAETQDSAGATVLVRPFVSPSCLTDAAHWRVGTRIVELDRVCVTDDESFMSAVGHEVGHALGMVHVCEDSGQAGDCSPVGFGPAMMGPKLRAADLGPGWSEVQSGAAGHPNPTDLDLAEYRRTHPVRALVRTDGGAP